MPELKMQFDPSTLEHLGIQMYSRLPNALAELIANAYDADASIVEIKLYDSDENNKKIEIIDDGMGMSFEEVNDKFLRIGRHRRTFDGNRKTPKGRIITGRKGLGKLALFGIGKNIQITTKNGGSTDELTFDLNWNDITNCDDSEYKPNFTIQQDKEAVESYTRIVLSELERKSAFDLDLISNSLSRLFNLMDDNFRIFLSLNDDNCIEITKELKYSNIETEFKWKINETVNEIGINLNQKTI
jgi:HSP90 family molecular chaperone